MKKKNSYIYDNDKNTEKVRRNAARNTFYISVFYLIFMFILCASMKFPIGALLSYPLAFVVGTFVYFNRKLPPLVYECWFTFSSATLCAVFCIFSRTFTLPLIIFMAAHTLTAMFRSEKLILFHTVLGVVYSVACCIINSGNPLITDNTRPVIELFIVPACILVSHFSLTSLVKRDKQLFLFAQQKNLNNTTLLQLVETKMNEAEAAVKVKGEFLANTSHEIRTPMNSIMGMAELALREDVSPRIRTYLNNIRDAGGSLLNIINDILDFSKIESDKIQLSVSEYSVLSLINDVCNIISVRLNSEAVQLITCISPDMPDILIGDERRIKQIILNLAGNAAKYTHHGSITISLHTEKTENGVIFYCEVSDTGIGIREQDIKRLFNAFERADAKRNRNIEGTGLGLAICKTLTEMMGGSLKVKSVYGAGSVFSFAIPQAVKSFAPCIQIGAAETKDILLCVRDTEKRRAMCAELSSLGLKHNPVPDIDGLSLDCLKTYSDVLIDFEEYCRHKSLVLNSGVKVSVIADPGTKIPASDGDIRKIDRPVSVIALLSLFGNQSVFSKSGENLNPKTFCAPDAKILIVDDNETNLTVAKKLISLYCGNIDTAQSGIQALKLVQRNDYDIIFMDHMMPELDGIETAQAIRSLGGKYKNLIIIALTANVMNGADELFKDAGMNDFLGKPIEMTALNRILSRYIPEEKRILPSDKPRNKAAESQSFITALYSIDGMDVKTALEQCGGSEHVLADVLRTAAASPSFEKLKAAYEKDDQRNYTIYIHGLKGALRNVGMNSLAELAYKLELAGKRGDHDFAAAHHHEFIRRYEDFAKAVTAAGEIRRKPSETEGSSEELLSCADEIITAADNMDYSLSVKILEKLKKASYGEAADKKIRALAEAVESFDFNEAAEIAEDIRQHRTKRA